MHRSGAKMEGRVTVDMVTPGRTYGEKGAEQMKFDTWYVRQFGKRPSKKPSWELDAEVSRLEGLLWDARALMRECQNWDAQHLSAGYAWDIQDKDKERSK
jgi:hypothetical protein